MHGLSSKEHRLPKMSEAVSSASLPSFGTSSTSTLPGCEAIADFVRSATQGRQPLYLTRVEVLGLEVFAEESGGLGDFWELAGDGV